MQTESFVVSHVKCQGCVQNIVNHLGPQPGVSEVEVDLATGMVTVQGNDLARATLAAQLTALGYPEKA